MDDDDEEILLLDAETPRTKWKNTKIGLFHVWSAAILILISYIQVYALIGSLGSLFYKLYVVYRI